MKKKKLFVAATDAGFINSILPAMENLREQFELEVYLQTSGAGKMVEKLSYSCQKLITVGDTMYPIVAHHTLLASRPDYVLCGLSRVTDPSFESSALVDQTIMTAALNQGIPVVGMLETPYMEDESIFSRFSPSLKPNKMIVTSAIMKNRLVALELYKAEDVFILPSPANAEYAKVDSSVFTTQKARRLNGLAKDDFTLVFLSSARPEVDTYILDLIKRSAHTHVLMGFHPKDRGEREAEYLSKITGARRLNYAGMDALDVLHAIASGPFGLVIAHKTSMLWHAYNAGCNTIGISKPGDEVIHETGHALGLIENTDSLDGVEATIWDVMEGGMANSRPSVADLKAPKKFVKGLAEQVLASFG